MTHWFKAFRVAPGVHRIEEGGLVSAYLAEGSEWAALIDTGMGIGDISVCVRELTPRPVTVINTHSHLDHVGGNRFFESAAVHQAENVDRELVAILRFRKMATQKDFPVPFPSGFQPSDYDPRVPAPTQRLAGGEAIKLGGRSLQVLHTPGHTPGSICLLDEANRFLFCGDMVTSRSLHGVPVSVGLDTYVSSLQMLAELAPNLDLVLPGHGQSPLPGSAIQELAGAAAEALQNLDRFSEMTLGWRKVKALQCGRFTFFVTGEE